LGSEDFIERHSAKDQEVMEIPRAQRKAVKPTLEKLFAKGEDAGIAQAYREHGYRLHQIAAHLGVHYAMVSRKLKKIERRPRSHDSLATHAQITRKRPLARRP
jgi:putative transposase